MTMGSQSDIYSVFSDISNYLAISLIELVISLNELVISLNELVISLNTFSDISNSTLN